MSTNKTEHYQLNQWVKSDQVLMDDFNADNRKIDGALKAQAEAIAAETAAREGAVAALEGKTADLAQRHGLHLIKTVMAEAQGTSARLSMTDIDWDRWRIVHVVIEPRLDSHGLVTVYANGNRSTVFSIRSGNSPGASEPSLNLIHLIFFPFYDRRNCASCLALAHGLTDVTFALSSLTSLHLSCNEEQTILTTTRFQVFGER